MNTDKHNNMEHATWNMKHLKQKACYVLRAMCSIKEKESGQILLVAVMLLAVTLTIVLSITFSSRTDTQLTKLEQENQKALAAAEAGIEAALKASSGQVIIGNSGSVPSGGTRILTDQSNTGTDEFTGSAVATETYDKNFFVTPLVEKDEQYSFYMGAYDAAANTIGASTAENLLVCFGTPGQSTKTAVEIAVVKGTGAYTIERQVLDPENPVRISNASTPTDDCLGDSAFAYSATIDADDIATDTKFVIVRVLYSSSKLRFSRTTNLPSQGKFVSSEATSTTGVSKKVELFQSYPQIPADFFVTGF